MEIEKIYWDSFNELKNLGIPVREASVIVAPLKELAGKCIKYNNPEKFEISIMQKLVNANNIWMVKRTMIHELLHTCDGCYNHNSKWREYAKIAEDYGHYGLFEAYDNNTLFHKELPVVRTFKCPDCGLIYQVREDVKEAKCPWCHKQMQILKEV